MFVVFASADGLQSFLTSPRNSPAGHVALLTATNCIKVIFTAEFRIQVQDLALEIPLHTTSQVPELRQLLTVRDHVGYKSRRNRYMRDDETVVILHSSGTTGLPKPVHLKAGVIRVAAAATLVPTPEGRRSVPNEIFGSTMLLAVVPFFHVFGILMLVRSLYYQRPLALLPAGSPPTAEAVLDAISTIKPTAVACSPSILEDICGLPEGLATLLRLESIFYGGAPLARRCGDAISRVTNLCNGIGSTEAFMYSNLVPADPADWEYFEWCPSAGIAMESTGDGQLAELVIYKSLGADYPGVFYNFPKLTEWRSRDLYEQHPAKPALWRHVGRVDDMIVLSNGEKVNPASFEKAIEAHPWVRVALVVGVGQFHTGLILEPHPERDAVGMEEFIKEVWARVEAANSQGPAHARVWRSMITLTMPGKPFIRTAKGSVMRQASYRLYQNEIELLYATDDIQTLAELNDTQVMHILRNALRSVLGSRAEALADDTNIFGLGADSLQVLQLRQLLRSAGIVCTTGMIYRNPSMNLLLRAVRRNCDCTTVSREERMSAMIHRFSKFTQGKVPSGPRAMTGCVLLVGSTGSLGTYLLHELLTQMRRVYCLNRSADAAERQVMAFVDRGLDRGGLKKAHFLVGEMSAENFGLDPEEYSELKQNVDTLVLNGWPVNFNNTLERFESVIEGVLRCVDFAAQTPRRPHIFFVSSVASVMNYPAVRDAAVVPEEFDPDNSLPAKQGYGESKHVAACILAKAVKQSLVSATILRVGQLAGSAKGKGLWNPNGKSIVRGWAVLTKSEWLPSLIKTSKTMGKIPLSLGPAHDYVKWVPADGAARVILDLLGAQAPLGLECFNIVNPQHCPWRDLVAVVRQYFGSNGRTLEPVGLDQWLGELRTVDAASGERYPALKLLDFFEGMKADKALGFATEKGVSRSVAMATMGPVDGTLMRKWLGECVGIWIDDVG